MREHDLQYLRDMVTIAMTDHSSQSKGQLEAFDGFGLARTNRYPRTKHRDLSLNGRMISREVEPVKCWSTHSSATPRPQIDRIDYQHASWRRAILALSEAEQSWLFYCYGKDLNFEHQITITRYVWDAFQLSIQERRISKKVKERLRALVWLAVQDSSQCKERNYYQSDLAKMIGVAADNWNKNYKEYWQKLLFICRQLDCDALRKMKKIRLKNIDINHWL